jgi:predicted DNA-binding transcriptional regulator AlpA
MPPKPHDQCAPYPNGEHRDRAPNANEVSAPHRRQGDRGDPEDGAQGLHRAALTVAEFCAAYRISRSALYQLWAQGIGPKYFKIGVKILISIEAADQWRREREAAA